MNMVLAGLGRAGIWTGSHAYVSLTYSCETVCDTYSKTHELCWTACGTAYVNSPRQQLVVYNTTSTLLFLHRVYYGIEIVSVGASSLVHIVGTRRLSSLMSAIKSKLQWFGASEVPLI